MLKKKIFHWRFEEEKNCKDENKNYLHLKINTAFILVFYCVCVREFHMYVDICVCLCVSECRESSVYNRSSYKF